MLAAPVTSSELFWQVQGRAACPREFAAKAAAAAEAPSEPQEGLSKWLQTSTAPRLHNFLLALNALYCTFPAVCSEDSHTDNPYPAQRNLPPGSQSEAAAGILLLWFVHLDIFKLFFHIISYLCCWCSLPPATIRGWLTVAIT